MLKDHQDAHGHGIYDYLTGNGGQANILEIIERDDGYLDVPGGPKTYFSKYKDWSPAEKKAMRYARGKVLDIGCGAGRHSLYLQGKGLLVMGIDNSPLAIKVCKLRGLENTKVMPISQINSTLGIFDTVLMLGNNFGLFGSYEGSRRLLGRLGKITSGNGRIIAQSRDIYTTKSPEHLSYHEFNRKKGRMAGQIRMRVRYKKYATPWFDYLMVSKEEMKNILEGTDWRVNKYVDSDGSAYIAIIDKVKE